MFSLIGVGERSGTGLNELFNLWKKEGLEEPIIEERVEPDRVTITLYTNKINNMQQIQLPEKQRIVYETILNNPGLKVPNIASLLNYDILSTENAVKKLRKNKLIEFIGSRKKGGYFVKNSTE